MGDLIKREDAISRAWIKNTCKEKIAHYKMRKNRIMAQKSISYDPKPQIEGFDDEIAIYEWILREVDNVPSAEKQGEWILEDGTLVVKVKDGSKVGRVLVEGENHFGGLYYLDDDTKQGEWIYCEDDEGQDGYRCSECGFFVPWHYGYEDINYIYKYHACPSCMARMKGADDE